MDDDDLDDDLDERPGGGRIDASRPLSGPGGAAAAHDAFDDVDSDLMWFSRNDIGNAERLIRRHGVDLRHVDQAGWHVWDGRRWYREGGEAETVKRAHLTARAARREAAAFAAEDGVTKTEVSDYRKFAAGLGNASKINAMIAQAAPYLRAPLTDMDRAHFRMTVLNGVLDLGDLEDQEDGVDPIRLAPHDRDDLTTLLAPVTYDPLAEAPRWLAFLDLALPDRKIQAFLQRFFGYSLTGDISEQALLILFGPGGNGKSTFLNAVKAVIGDYHRAAAIETFLHNDRQSGSQATPDRARLYGARLVTAVEPSSGARLSENMLKTVTGGDTLTARHLHKEDFEFVPAFKLILSCNTRPHIRGVDEGIWRRILTVPFKRPIHKMVEVDRHIDAKLAAEASGILNWLLDGYRMWREIGLKPPEQVLAETRKYRADSDPVGEFLAEWTVADPDGHVGATDLYEAYVRWCKQAGADAYSHTGFGKIAGQKLERVQKGTRVYVGIRLTQDALPPLPPGEGLE